MYDRIAARSNAFYLLGQVFLVGLTADLLSDVEAVLGTEAWHDQPYDADEAAADHQHLFGFNVFPLESIFLDPSNLSGGPVTEAVTQAYQEVGFNGPDLSVAPDHVGCELLFLSYLCAAEADAWRGGRESHAKHLRHLQHAFLSAHLLRWLPAVVQAIRQQGIAFYPALAELALAFVCDHLQSLVTKPVSPEDTFALAPAPDILSDERTGIKEIATYLITPVYSGFYLSRDDIGRLGRGHNLPRGFGGRALMMTNLLRSAAAYDSLDPLLDDLLHLGEVWHTGYLEVIDVPEPLRRPWLTCLERTTSMLRTLKGAGMTLQEAS